jgi:DNA-binding transcriptional LysR family regulator
MLKLEAVQAFASIVETGSITGAARRLALSKSVISERLAELERALDAKLVHRTTRALALTEDGTAFYARARLILRDVDAAASELSERRGKLAGPLRISGPVSFELTLELDDRFIDIVAEGYDAVIRHGPVADKRVIAKRITATRRLLVASPEYLERHGTPTSLQELERHPGIIYSNRGAADWRFHVGRKVVTVRPRRAFYVNNGLVMRDAAVAGLGIALLTKFIVHSHLKSGALEVIGVGAEPEGATVHIAYPQHLRASGKIRALTSSLQQSFGNPPYWER